MKLKNTSWVRVFESAVLIGLLAFLLFWHLRVGLIRFFDVDEFTHLHWAANIARGERPYIDFFTFFTPGFYWLLMPLFWFYGKSLAIFTGARIFAFVVFTGITILTGALFFLIRSKRFALLPMILLAFLPMPYDKFMELRPDNVSTLLGLAGVVLQIYAMTYPLYKKRALVWFLSGMCYAFSLVVLVKILPFVVMGMMVFAWNIGVHTWVGQSIAKKRIMPLVMAKDMLFFLYSFIGVIGLFVIYLLSLGNFDIVWYSLTKLPFEANTIGRVYIMEPHLFFFPNASFYGGPGVTAAFIINHAIWTIGILMGCYRLLTPFITGNGDQRKVCAEVLIAGIFILSVFGYVLFFPLKHSQYLIPIAVFIAFYAADAMTVLLKNLTVYGGRLTAFVAIVLLACIIVGQTIAVNASKLTQTSQVQLSQVTLLLENIPAQKEILDLDGRLLFWKDAYDICCLPFGTFTQFLSRPPRPLSQVLEEKKVPYIYQGDSGRLWELRTDLEYIQSHYERVPGWGEGLWVRK